MTVNRQTSSVQLHDAGEGVFWIAIADRESGNTLSKPLISELLQTLQTVREAQSLKVVVLKGLAQSFLQGGRESIDDAVENKLFQTIATFPCPVIAAMQGDATGAGLMLTAVCDFMVCSREARYGFTSAVAPLFPSAQEERLFGQRFGELQAQQLLYGAGPVMGKAQRWSCLVVPADEVEAHARKLAATLAGKSERSLCLLKQHLAQSMVELCDSLGEVAQAHPVGLRRDRVRVVPRSQEALVDPR